MNADAGANADDPKVKNVGMYQPLPFSVHYHGAVWHFTDAAALVSIVVNKKLWASAATVMNDLSELTYGAERIKNWYDGQGEELEGGDRLHSILTKRMRTIVDDILSDPAYVVSASTDYRILNQWRNYGGTKGVAIRFEPHADLVPAHPPMMDGLLMLPQWVEVAYMPERQDDRIRTVMKTFSEGTVWGLLESGDLESADLFIGATLASLAASLKDNAYAEEKEVRLISWIPDGQHPKHRGTDRGVVPYLEIQHYENIGWALTGVDGIANADAPLPIEEIRVGPPEGESERQRIVGVRSLLKANGYDVPVNGSTIAYLPA